MSDPISNMLISIKNAAMVGKEVIFIPFSKQKLAILKIFIDKKYIKSFQIEKNDRLIKIVLASHTAESNFSDIKRISKPGRRVYIKASAIPYPKHQLGVFIISTPKGIMTGGEAKKHGFGGELICEVK